MITNLVTWFNGLNLDPSLVNGAIAGLLSSIIMFLLSDVFWRTHLQNRQIKFEFSKQRLEKFYSPIYQFYREAFNIYDERFLENQETKQERQPFFKSDFQEKNVVDIVSSFSGLASSKFLRSWNKYRNIKNNENKNKIQKKMIRILIRDFHSLRRRVYLGFDLIEFIKGSYRKYIV